jgi:hypothetical protein
MPVGARTVDLGITRTWWVPDATVTAFPVITAAMLSAATDLTPFMLTDYSVRMDGSDSVNERGIGDLADINVPTIKKYTGSLHMFRSIIAATGLAGSDDPLTTFAGNNESGYLVRRVGPLKSVAPAASQVVEAYKFIADSPQIEGGTGSGFLKVTVPLFSVGVFSLSIALT